MKLKCTALRSYVMTAKPSQSSNNDSEVLKFKDFQGPLTSNSKTFKALFHFQGLSRSWKMERKNFKDFQELSRPCGHPVIKCNDTCSSHCYLSRLDEVAHRQEVWKNNNKLIRVKLRQCIRLTMTEQSHRHGN